MTDLPLMPKATAVWLVENTTLTFRQIAEFCGMHELEVQGIADGEVAIGIKGLDPIANNQLTAGEIKRCEADPAARLEMIEREVAPPVKRKGPRYTPVSKRQDRPAAIAWLVRYHPELEDSQIGKLIGTTKPTIQSIRNRTHWNISSIQPVDPVALGLCKQTDLDEVVRKAAEKKAKAQEPVPSSEERISLMSTDESLNAPVEPGRARKLAEFENISLDDPRGPAEEEEELDADSLFNLPSEEKSGKG
ncbi:MAG TPA: cell cycle transcriptional regulator TrcR [Thermohalobaculum sp.]|nr:cell cycle transcriptional regulator TrcR [Thermohalobaculum sp.]